jgi:Uma2 family endonuclease
MSIVSARFKQQLYSPVAKTEQELAYELLNEPSWSEEAYLTFSEAFNRPMELSDGRLTILPIPSLTHQRILREFTQRAENFLGTRKLGELLFAAHPIRLRPGKYREPDAMIWLNEHKERMGERESGPPDLVLEIVSPTNEALDLETKFKEYAEAGISEYWIVLPETRRVSVYHLDMGNYQLVAHFGAGEHARSITLPGFEIELKDLLQAAA